MVTAGCDSVVDDDELARSLVNVAGLGLVHVGIFVWSGTILPLIHDPSSMGSMKHKLYFCIRRDQYVRW